MPQSLSSSVNVTAARSSRSESKVVCIVLACVAAFWLVTINIGTLGNFDTDLRVRMAHAWWSGEPEVDPDLPAATSRLQIEYGVVGAAGKRLVFYDPGQSLLMVPYDWLATQLSRYVQRFPPNDLRGALLVWTLFLPLNVAVVLAAFWLLIGLGVEPRLAALSSLIWLLGTTVLFYAQVPYQNNQVLLCVLLAFAAILHWAARQRSVLLIVSGLAIGGALLVRADAAIYVLVVGLFLLVALFAKLGRNPDRIRALGLWALGFLPLAIVGRAFDYFRYGGLVETGQSLWVKSLNTDPLFAGLPQVPAAFPFTNTISEGILGVLFSPAKSLFLYDPLLLPCLVAIAFAWKRFSLFVRCYVSLIALDLVLRIGITSRLDFWHGDWSWAARYHVTSVELLLLPILPYLVQRAAARGGWAWAIRLCLVLAVATQALGVSMPYGAEIEAEKIETYPNCDQDTFYTDLRFRLKDRIVNLYCLSQSTPSGVCADPPVIAEAETKPLCATAITDLRRFRRLAFFPYHPQYAAAFPRFSMATWSLAALLAFATTLLLWRAFARRQCVSA